MNWDANEHYKSRQVALAYDRSRFASLPGRVFNRLEQRVVKRCFAAVPSGATIVDVPCGTGRLADALLAAGYRVHGLDISAAMLEVATDKLARYGNRFSWEVGDVKAAAAIERPAYDAALCARVLMHFTLDEQVEFLTAVAKLSSRFVVINHSLDSAYQRFRRRLKRLLGDRHDPARSPVSNRDIDTLLRRSGLREVRRYRLLSPVSEAIYIVAEKLPATSRSRGPRTPATAAAS